MATLQADQIEMAPEHQAAIAVLAWGWLMRSHHPTLWKSLSFTYRSAARVKDEALKGLATVVKFYLQSETLDRLPDLPL